MSDTFTQFRLRDMSALKALQDFGEMYAHAARLQTDELRGRLKRVMDLANAKANEARQLDDDTYRRAEAASQRAKEKLDAHLRETKGARE